MKVTVAEPHTVIERVLDTLRVAGERLDWDEKVGLGTLGEGGLVPVSVVLVVGPGDREYIEVGVERPETLPPPAPPPRDREGEGESVGVREGDKVVKREGVALGVNEEKEVGRPETLPPPPAPPSESVGEAEELVVVEEENEKREGLALGEYVEVGE